MQSSTFTTPEAAALAGFPAAHARVVASARAEDDAYVLLDTGPEGHPYLYGTCLRREHGGWREVASGNGPGWTLTDPDAGLGTAVVWGQAPEAADRVRAVLHGRVREADVADGVYLVAWWRVAFPGPGHPRVEAFRVHGRWNPADPDL
jgi:hypothetical protein